MRRIDLPIVEVRGFKWPRRPTSIATAYFLGEDTFGKWLGVVAGRPWRSADHLQSGVFEVSFVKVIPDDAFWTACFDPFDPVVDVDIVFPVNWIDWAVEEVDLELDILRFADGSVRVRDQDEFERVRSAWKSRATSSRKRNQRARDCASWCREASNLSEKLDLFGSPAS
jgi:uncharacterized protein